MPLDLSNRMFHRERPVDYAFNSAADFGTPILGWSNSRTASTLNSLVNFRRSFPRFMGTSRERYTLLSGCP